MGNYQLPAFFDRCGAHQPTYSRFNLGPTLVVVVLCLFTVNIKKDIIFFPLLTVTDVPLLYYICGKGGDSAVVKKKKKKRRLQDYCYII